MPLKLMPIYLFITILTVIITLTPNCFSANYTAPQTFAYVLQADEISDNKESVVKLLRDCDRDIIVIDPFFTTNLRWSKDDISSIRSGKPGRKVIAYISIGEAEDYRYYWQKEWSTPSSAPAFLCEENPDWVGNFKVKYWQQEWQQVVFSEITPIISTGFDGLLLDIVDAFEYFERDPELGYEDNKINSETGNSFRSDMIEFIKKIRQKLDSEGDRELLLIPQNGTQLLISPVYQEQISMQAIENLFTNDDKIQDNEHTDYVMNFLNSLITQGIPILLTEYPTKNKYLQISMDSAHSKKLLLLQTSRALDQLGISKPID